MGTGYTRTDTSNNIANGNVIDADDLDGEFNAIESAFNSSTGHTHDGTSAEGAPIEVTGPNQEYLSDATALFPKTDGTYDLGKTGAEWKDLYIDGVANIDSLVADTADINGGTIDGATIGGASAGVITGTTITGTSLVGPLTGDVTSTGTSSFATVTVSGTVDGRDLSADGTKLDGIEASADVTDTANVTAAGALMDSELTDITAVKALDQGVATTDSPTFAETTITGDLTVDTNTLSVDAANNRVGIGTGSPSEKLDVGGGVARFANNTTPAIEGDAAAYFGKIGGTAFMSNSAAVSFRTASTERMRIDSSGKVGIGTSSPTNLLDVNADSIRVRTAQTPATAGAAGNQGEIAWDADYIYVCVATNTWKRVAIATW